MVRCSQIYEFFTVISSIFPDLWDFIVVNNVLHRSQIPPNSKKVLSVSLLSCKRFLKRNTIEPPAFIHSMLIEVIKDHFHVIVCSTQPLNSLITRQYLKSSNCLEIHIKSLIVIYIWSVTLPTRINNLRLVLGFEAASFLKIQKASNHCIRFYLSTIFRNIQYFYGFARR